MDEGSTSTVGADASTRTAPEPAGGHRSARSDAGAPRRSLARRVGTLLLTICVAIGAAHLAAQWAAELRAAVRIAQATAPGDFEVEGADIAFVGFPMMPTEVLELDAEHVRAWLVDVEDRWQQHPVSLFAVGWFDF